jgi:hypothetical protein
MHGDSYIYPAKELIGLNLPFGIALVRTPLRSERVTTR